MNTSMWVLRYSDGSPSLLLDASFHETLMEGRYQRFYFKENSVYQVSQDFGVTWIGWDLDLDTEGYPLIDVFARLLIATQFEHDALPVVYAEPYNPKNLAHAVLLQGAAETEVSS